MRSFFTIENCFLRNITTYDLTFTPIAIAFFWPNDCFLNISATSDSSRVVITEIETDTGADAEPMAL